MSSSISQTPVTPELLSPCHFLTSSCVFQPPTTGQHFVSFWSAVSYPSGEHLSLPQPFSSHVPCVSRSFPHWPSCPSSRVPCTPPPWGLGSALPQISTQVGGPSLDHRPLGTKLQLHAGFSLSRFLHCFYCYIIIVCCALTDGLLRDTDQNKTYVSHASTVLIEHCCWHQGFLFQRIDVRSLSIPYVHLITYALVILRRY